MNAAFSAIAGRDGDDLRLRRDFAQPDPVGFARPTNADACRRLIGPVARKPAFIGR